MNQVSLTSAMSMNLLSLKQTSSAMSGVQNRLATGLKVNSALDNPSAYYTAVSLNNRASDLNSLLDSMGQAIQTVKAAVEGIASATAILEQMSSIAEQAVSSPVSVAGQPIEKFVNEGYTAITAAMDASEIEALITDGAKLVLADDINLSSTLNIAANNVTINGNGHKLSFKGSNAGENLLSVSGTDAKISNIKIDYENGKGGAAVLVIGDAEISNVKIEASGTGVYGIQAQNGGSVKLDGTKGINVSGIGSQALSSRVEELYNGKANTQAIIGQIGAAGLAASAANQFYVGSKTDANFGQGNWYLPAVGELMEVYGYNAEDMTGGYGTSGMTGENKVLINAALSTLKGKGVESEVLTNVFVWSSSEYYASSSWGFNMNDGNRYNNYKDNYNYVRCFQLLENCFNPLTPSDGSAGGSSNSGAVPKIGDVMYSDLSYGSADDYDGSKTAVGVVTWVSEDGKSAKIMNLKDLTFSSYSSENNFDPDNPYGGSYKYSYHTTSAKYSEDITDITNYNSAALLNAMKSGGTIAVDGSLSGSADNGGSLENIGVSTEWAKAYNGVLNQYNMLINDASYKGINLLKGEALNVVFNESKSSRLNITGQDISSSALGLSEADWKNISDVSVSISDLRRTIAALRSLSGELGNNYSVVQSRQDFTENLINILTEGADKLTLADMNEESAVMLALQTRQQLAINSLSLASQSGQSVLRLFA